MAKVISSGFESAFLDSWGGWDELDTGVFGFYNPEFNEDMRSTHPTADEIDFVVFDLNKMLLEGYREEDVLLTVKIKLVAA